VFLLTSADIIFYLLKLLLEDKDKKDNTNEE
jgi:hypothetical protein